MGLSLVTAEVVGFDGVFLYDGVYCISSNNTLPHFLITPAILVILCNNFMLFLIRPAFEDHKK